MVRTQIYLSETEKSALRKIAARNGKKQSELIRLALDQFIAAQQTDRRLAALERTAGMWKQRADLPDFRRVRQTWDR